MTKQKKAAQARELLEALSGPFAALRARAVREFAATQPDNDVGRLSAWAMMRALDQIEAEVRRPIEDLALTEASQGSTSHDGSSATPFN